MMSRPKFTSLLLAGLLVAAPAFADGHKPGCRGLDPATASTNSACED